MLHVRMEASATLTGRSREDASIAALPAAFERLFLAEHARVARVAYRVLGDAAEAEDVAQEVFVSFYRRHRADAPYAAPWLHAAAAHTALNVARGRARRERREDAAGRENERTLDPEAEAIASEERALVRAALTRLPDGTAALLALRYSGLSYAEVAEALGIKADQVGTRLRRALDAFKKEVLRGAP